VADPMFVTVDGEGERRTVRFTRYLSAPPNEAWDAITMPATRLLLTHRLLPSVAAAGYGAGWHAYLDILASVFGASRPEWLSRFQEVKPDYERAAAST
jgi:hypothetical protein